MQQVSLNYSQDTTISQYKRIKAKPKTNKITMKMRRLKSVLKNMSFLRKKQLNQANLSRKTPLKKFHRTEIKKTPKRIRLKRALKQSQSESFFFNNAKSFVTITTSHTNRSLSKDKKFLSPRGKSFFQPSYSIKIDFRPVGNYLKKSFN